MQIYGPANIFNIDIKAMDARFPFWVNEPKIFVAFKKSKNAWIFRGVLWHEIEWLNHMNMFLMMIIACFLKYGSELWHVKRNKKPSFEN